MLAFRQPESDPRAMRRLLGLVMLYRRPQLPQKDVMQALDEASSVVACFFRQSGFSLYEIRLVVKYLRRSSLAQQYQPRRQIVESVPPDFMPFQWSTFALIKQCGKFARTIYQMVEYENSQCNSMHFAGLKLKLKLKNCPECIQGLFQKLLGSSQFKLQNIAFDNNAFRVPYLVAIPKNSKHIIIAVRGTVSSHDEITNMAVGLETINEREDFKAHRGMAKAAEYIHLTEFNKLKAYFKDDYQVITTGHSLGAGVAAILATLLEACFPGKVRCVAICPPGWVVSRSLAIYTKDFCLSIVNGEDVVSRLCPQIDLTGVINSMDEIIDGVPHKLNILTQFVAPLLLRTNAFWSWICNSMQKKKRALAPKCEDLFIPGRIIHIAYENVYEGLKITLHNKDQEAFSYIEELRANSLSHHTLSKVIESLNCYK